AAARNQAQVKLAVLDETHELGGRLAEVAFERVVGPFLRIDDSAGKVVVEHELRVAPRGRCNYQAGSGKKHDDSTGDESFHDHSFALSVRCFSSLDGAAHLGERETGVVLRKVSRRWTARTRGSRACSMPTAKARCQAGIGDPRCEGRCGNTARRVIAVKS